MSKQMRNIAVLFIVVGIVALLVFTAVSVYHGGVAADLLNAVEVAAIETFGHCVGSTSVCTGA